MFLGYSPTKKGYKCYHPPTKKTYVTKDVTFVEDQYYFCETYLQGESDSRDEDRWDWHEEENPQFETIDPTQFENINLELKEINTLQPQTYQQWRSHP